MTLKSWLIGKITAWLAHEHDSSGQDVPLCDFDRLSVEIRPCDVLLVEGRTRISSVIKNITQTAWTHSALYIGRISEIDDPIIRAHISEYYQGDDQDQLVIEALLGEGTVINPLNKYSKEHLRICRPLSLAPQDAQHIIEFSSKHLGMEYDFRQLLDLARFMFPFAILPRRWRSSLFDYHPGVNSRTVCSSMIASAFANVHYPILPVVHRNSGGKLVLYRRNNRLYTPRDFDYSPYFDIIKYPIFSLDDVALYRQLPWDEEGVVCNGVNDCFLPDTKLAFMPKSQSVAMGNQSSKTVKMSSVMDALHTIGDGELDNATDDEPMLHMSERGQR